MSGGAGGGGAGGGPGQGAQAGTGPAAADFDPGRLAAYLGERFGPGPLRLERIPGGQSNPTYRIGWGGRSMVLRKQPPGPLLRGAHAIDREYRVLRALRDSPVPVPPVILFEQDPTILGTPFYLMEFVAGRVLTDGRLPGMAPAERRAIYMSLAETLARLHAIRPEEVGLGDFGRPGNYFSRQMARWGGQLAAATGPRDPALDALAERLSAMIPEDDGRVVIAHGDFRLGNMLFHPTEPRVIALLDWELATLGHPLADLGFCCMAWHSTPEEYGGILGAATEGIPTEAEFVARYREILPEVPPPQPFHLAFALFRFAVIFVGIAERAAVGTAADPEAARHAPLAHRFALRAWEVLGTPWPG